MEGGVGVVEVPVQRSNAVVVVRKDQLPSDEQVLEELLMGEVAPLSVRIDFALAYYLQGGVPSFVRLLEAGTPRDDPEFEGYYGDAAGRRARVQILSLLAGYHLRCYRLPGEAAAQQRAYHQEQIGQLLAQAEQLGTDALATCCKGLLALYHAFTLAGELRAQMVQRAQSWFSTALVADTTCLAALLGMAVSLFQLGDYKGALKQYRTVLARFPNIPVSIYYPIGQCFAKIGGHEAVAFDYFAHVLKHFPGHALASGALAALSFNAGRLGECAGYLQDAFAARGEAPPAAVLNTAAHLLVLLEQDDAAVDFAARAAEMQTLPEVRAHARTLLAQIAHSRGSHAEALGHYKAAVSFMPGYAPALYGLGQMAYLARNFTEARDIFAKIVEHCADDWTARRALGLLLSEMGEGDAAAQHLERSLQIRGVGEADDPAAWLVLARHYEASNPRAALEYYGLYAASARRRGARPSAQLLCNIGALHAQLDEVDEAASFFRKSAAVYGADAGGSGALSDRRAATPLYNLGRALERMNRPDDAARIYERLTQSFPEYIDAKLRLACVARDLGRADAAVAQLRAVADAHPASLDALALAARQLIDMHRFKDAQDLLERAQAVDRDDSSVSLLLAYLLYSADRAKYGRYFFNACCGVLRAEPGNVAAANGLGVWMAQLGHLNEARELFLSLRETAGESRDVLLNLGHVYLGLGKFPQAVSLYEQCIKRFPCDSQTASFYIYRAKALFHSDEHLSALRDLSHAAVLNPENLRIKYNMAAMSYLATHAFLQNSGMVTLATMRQSIARLEAAVRVLAELQSLSPAEIPASSAFDTKAVEGYVVAGEKLIEKARVYLQGLELQSQQREEDHRRALEQERRRQAELERVRAEESSLAADAERLVDQERERKLAAVVEGLRQPGRSGGPGRGRRGRGAAALEEEEEEDNEENAAAADGDDGGSEEADATEVAEADGKDATDSDAGKDAGDPPATGRKRRREAKGGPRKRQADNSSEDSDDAGEAGGDAPAPTERRPRVRRRAAAAAVARMGGNGGADADVDEKADADPVADANPPLRADQDSNKPKRRAAPRRRLKRGEATASAEAEVVSASGPAQEAGDDGGDDEFAPEAVADGGGSE